MRFRGQAQVPYQAPADQAVAGEAAEQTDAQEAGRHSRSATSWNTSTNAACPITEHSTQLPTTLPLCPASVPTKANHHLLPAAGTRTKATRKRVAAPVS